MAPTKNGILNKGSNHDRIKLNQTLSTGGLMVSAYMFQNIRNLKEQGKSQAEIARELDLDPKTVAKYVRANSPPRYKKREKSTREEFVFG